VEDSAAHTADAAVYGISVAAELVGVAQPTLRLYERKGLVKPRRTSGGTRRYSENDVYMLRRVGQLVEAGVNLAGVAIILRLESDNRRLHRDLEAARRSQANERGVRTRPGTRPGAER